MKQKGKSAFTSSGHGKHGKVIGKHKSHGERRGFFSGIKQLGGSASGAGSSKSREGKLGNSKGSNESMETKI